MKLLFAPLLASLLLFPTLVAGAGHTSACYNTTTSILMAQLDDPPIKDFVICPDTTIAIGLPADTTFTTFAGGDVPLTVIHDDVTIKCGDDGDPANNCMLSGGYVQLGILPQNPFVPDRTISTNNLLIKGLTFTGELTDLPGGLTSIAAFFSAPGTGMVLEDCSFKDLKAFRVVSNAMSILTARELYPFFSSELTLKNCDFRDVTYGYEVVRNADQTMMIQDSSFTTIALDQDCGCVNSHVVGNFGGVLDMTRTFFDVVSVRDSVAYFNPTLDEDAPDDAVSTFTFSNNVEGLTIHINSDDFCEDGLLVENNEEETSNSIDCQDLFVEEEGGPDGGTMMGFTFVLLLVSVVSSAFAIIVV